MFVVLIDDCLLAEPGHLVIANQLNTNAAEAEDLRSYVIVILIAEYLRVHIELLAMSNKENLVS